MDDGLDLAHAARIAAALGPLGWACGDIRFLAQGANNRVYALEAGGRSLVAKIGTNPASRHLDLEWAFLRAHRGIGPECLAWAMDADGSQLLIQERVPGRHPFALDELGLESLGRLLRRCHGSAAPEGTPTEDWRGFMRHRILPPPQTGPHAGLAAELARGVRGAVERGEALDARAAAGAKVPVHGDLIPLNIIEQSPEGFCIIDWEGLRLDEPEADVVTLFKAYRCGPGQEAAFIRGYGPGLREGRLRFRRLLHDLQVAAWRLACQIPGARGEGLDKALAETREELDHARQALDGGGTPPSMDIGGNP